MTFFTLLLLPMLIGASPATAATVHGTRAPCRLEVDNAHISANLISKESKRAVKVTFRSVCNVDQTNLEMHVQIFKTGIDGNHPVTKTITQKFPLVKANRNVVIQNVYAYCKNTKRTTYYGVANAQARIRGEQVVANQVQSTLLVALNCGT
jgi:hypothetical protein